MSALEDHHRIRHGDDRRPAVRSADRARAGRVRARPADARAARGAGDRRRAQFARPDRDRDRHAPAARSGAGRASDRHEWRSASNTEGESYGLLIDAIGEVLKLPVERPRAQSGQPRCRGSPAFRPACTGWRTGSWSCSTSIACSISGRQRKQHEVATTSDVMQMNRNRGGARPQNEGEAVMKTCLVVDDSSVIRKVARRILEGLEFQIVEAEDGEQALDACRSKMPDAILLDWNMPKMDGYEFLRNLRRLPGRRSAEGRVLHDRERRRSYRAGAACRRQRVHHEALRQGDRRSQVPGGRVDLISVASLTRTRSAASTEYLRSAMSIVVASAPAEAALATGSHPRDGGRRRRRRARPVGALDRGRSPASGGRFAA